MGRKFQVPAWALIVVVLFVGALAIATIGVAGNAEKLSSKQKAEHAMVVACHSALIHSMFAVGYLNKSGQSTVAGIKAFEDDGFAVDGYGIIEFTSDLNTSTSLVHKATAQINDINALPTCEVK